MRSYKTLCSLKDFSGKVCLKPRKFPTAINGDYTYISLTQTLCSLILHFPNCCLLIGSKIAFLIPTPSPPSQISRILSPPAACGGERRGDGQGRLCSGARAAAQSPSLGGQSRCPGQEASETGSGGGGSAESLRVSSASPHRPSLTVLPATHRAGAAASSGRARRPGGSGKPAERPPPPPDTGLRPPPGPHRTRSGGRCAAAGAAAGPALPPASPPTLLPPPPTDGPGRGATIKIRTTWREPSSPRGLPAQRAEG